MDVVLLSRMIGQLMPDLDTLSLPGLGTFKAEQVGASFSDKGYTINPPYRRLTFTSAQTEDGLLADLYASSNGITAGEADSVLRSFAANLSEELRERKSVELPGLGRLRATREDHLFFVPDEDLDISPDACGLVSVSLKTHAAVMPSLEDMVLPQHISPAGDNTVGIEPPVQSGSAGDVLPDVPAADAPKAAPASRPRRKLSRAWIWTIAAVAAAVLVVGGFKALSVIAPDFTDTLLYTPEQLAIINAPEDGVGLPR